MQIGAGQGPENAAAPGRFARLGRGSALLLSFAIMALLLLAALVADRGMREPVPLATAAGVPVLADQPAKRDTDLALYDAIVERVASGESYYDAAVEEQRTRNFPVRPGLAVRLPTLATISALVGPAGLAFLALLLAASVAWAWWVRLRPIIEPPARRIIAMALLAIGCGAGFKAQYLALHEAWAGMLIALSLGLYRPGKWRAAWIAAALALAIREHALPFVLLLAALAAWRKGWRETGAWLVLVAIFAAGLALHVATVAQLTDASDPASPSWLALRGLPGWLDTIILSSGLHLLPAWLAAPLALLPLLGWASLRHRLGATAFLLYAGYGLFFMLAGRANNFYWGLIVVPAYFVGLYWVAAAIRELAGAIKGRTSKVAD